MRPDEYASRGEMLRNERMCLSKRAFPTRLEAATFANKTHQRFQRHQRPYHCPNCRWWHITTKPKSRKLKKGKRGPFSRKLAKPARMAELMVITFRRRSTTAAEPFTNQMRGRRLLLYWWARGIAMRTAASAEVGNGEGKP